MSSGGIHLPVSGSCVHRLVFAYNSSAHFDSMVALASSVQSVPPVIYIQNAKCWLSAFLSFSANILLSVL